MILLIGIPSEPPVRLLTEACMAKGIPHAIFSQLQQEDWTVNADPWHAGNSLLSNGPGFYRRLDECTGLYLRTMDHTRIPGYAEIEHKETITEMYRGLYSMLDGSTSCRIVNPPSAQMSNNSKPYQLLIIKKYGLDIPETCITSNEEEAAAFIAGHRSVIYKSISGTRSIVKKLDESDLSNLYKLKYCPVQFQECITGFNLRVHVVGQRTIATKICSDAVDYRYAHTQGRTATLEPFELSETLAEKCVQLAHGLHLPFAGLDLMIADDGRTICFEVNPSPGYSYYEQNTGQRISHALADYLAAPYFSSGSTTSISATLPTCPSSNRTLIPRE